MLKRFFKYKIVTVILVLVFSPLLAAYLKAQPFNSNDNVLIDNLSSSDQ